MVQFTHISAVALAALLLTACGGGGGGSAGGGSSGGSGGGTGGSGGGGSRTSLTINRSAPKQVLAGWEVTPRFWEFDKTGDRYDRTWLDSRDAIVNKLADEAGITRVRVEVRSGVENPVDYWTQFVNGTISYEAVKSRFYEKINDNADPAVANPAGFQWSSFDYYVENFVVPLRNRLATRGQTLAINLCYVDFGWTTNKGTLSHADSPDEYAELIVLAAKRLRDRYGINVDSLEIILEPDNTDRWSGDAIGRAAKIAKTKLAAAGINVKIIAPSPSAAGKTASYLDGIATVAGPVDVVSYHRYDAGLADLSLGTIRTRAGALGAETAMLEYVDGNVRDFFKDMEAGGASAWQLYGVATLANTADAAKNGYILWRSPAGAVGFTPQFSQIALVQRETRPGARAYPISANGSNMALDFQNPDGSDVIAVYSPGGDQFAITGAAKTKYLATFAASSAAAYTTSNITTDGAGALNVDVPAGSVVVLHSTN